MKSKIKIKDLTFNYFIPYEKNLSLKSVIINIFRTSPFQKYPVFKNFNLEIYNNDGFDLLDENHSTKNLYDLNPSLFNSRLALVPS